MIIGVLSSKVIMNNASNWTSFLRKLWILLTVAAFQQVCAVEPYTGSRIFWDTSTRCTVFNGGGYARVIELQDGRLMAVCESGGIKVAYSQNKGTSWGTATRIVENPEGINEAVPDLIQLADGTIIVAYNPRPRSPYSEERKFGIRCKRSTDNGRTWSDEIFVNDARHTFNDGCWEPSMLQLPSGEVQLYFADEGPYTTNEDQQISMCRSFDGGQTWSEPQKICYRQGFRDGMPVPVLLKDQSEMVVIIEDNGWGYGDFFPTTVRTSLQNNWGDGYWVAANDKNREKTLNLNYCPTATGGAPYLRVLPWGETVMSYQSAYEHNGKWQMRVAVGNEQARDFKAMTVPFIVDNENEGAWNSLCIIDTGIVVAVSGIKGNIEMIKGYPMRQLMAAYGQPVVDGRLTQGEGYKTRGATQIVMGWQTGTRLTADLAYDRDSLYFIARVADRTQVASNANGDGLTLLINVEENVNTAPQEGCYKLQVRMDGQLQRVQKGQKSGWATMDKAQMPLRTAATANTTSYTVEMALPWTALGLDDVPVGRKMGSALECTDNQDGTVVKETIPDANHMRPYTWMPLVLEEMPSEPEEQGVTTPWKMQRTIDTVCDLAGRRYAGNCHPSVSKGVRTLVAKGKKVVVR